MPSPTTLPPPTPISHPSPPSPSFYLIHDTIPHPWYDATLQTIRHCTLREQRGNHPLFPGGTKILHIKDWNEWKEVMRREGVSEGDVLCGVGVGGLVVLRWLEECKAAGVVLVDVSVAGDGDLETNTLLQTPFNFSKISQNTRFILQFTLPTTPSAIMNSSLLHDKTGSQHFDLTHLPTTHLTHIPDIPAKLCEWMGGRIPHNAAMEVKSHLDVVVAEPDLGRMEMERGGEEFGEGTCSRGHVAGYQ